MEKDYFEFYDELPFEVQEIIDHYSYMDNNYEMCQSLINDLENVGWTCEYGLDGIPYDLKQIK